MQKELGDWTSGTAYVRVPQPVYDVPPADFRIEVKDSTQGCQVTVFSKDGAQESPETAGKILTLLFEQLK